MEINPKEYLDMTTEELEAICEGLNFKDIAEASEEKKAALAAYILKVKVGGLPRLSSGVNLLDILFKLFSNAEMVDTIVKETNRIKEINEFIEQQPDKEELLKLPFDLDYMEQLMEKRKPSIKTRYPIKFIAPLDKISRFAFTGEHAGEGKAEIITGRKGSKKEISAIASIDLDNLDPAVQIKNRENLTAYDWEVHNAVCTLFKEGGNDIMTYQMIYQVMTGDPNAKLESKQARSIRDSITKVIYGQLTIDTSLEAEAYGFDTLIYDGTIISAERVTATLNGTPVEECLHLLRTPILLEYAEKKNQIGRFDLKLLNSPINKTEEIIALQGYLYRRILPMKGKGSSLSKTIVYDTMYNQIGITAASDGALRKKKATIRDHVKRIFEYWKSEGFISGYCENKRGAEIYSISVKV